MPRGEIHEELYSALSRVRSQANKYSIQRESQMQSTRPRVWAIRSRATSKRVESPCQEGADT